MQKAAAKDGAHFTQIVTFPANDEMHGCACLRQGPTKAKVLPPKPSRQCLTFLLLSMGLTSWKPFCRISVSWQTTQTMF
jgi:hypothetical protein